MKQIFRHTILVATLCMFAACTQDELAEPTLDARCPLSITVAGAGYVPGSGITPASVDAPSTRATENGYATEFTAGDACGLFIVQNGTVVTANVKLSATDNGTDDIAWKSEETLWYEPGGVYYLYYPWQEAPQGAPGEGDAVTATNDADFFSAMITAWHPTDDQSEYAAYTASDLMTAQAEADVSASDVATLSFTMVHRMALVVVKMPVSENTEPAVVLSAQFDENARPYAFSDGVYRYLVNPASGTKLVGYYDNGTREFVIEIAADYLTGGSYKTYNVDSEKANVIHKSVI